jgi:hypothetical protein
MPRDARDRQLARAGSGLGFGAVLDDQIEDGFGIVAAIGNGICGGLQAREQGRHGSLVGGLARREDEPDRQSSGIDGGRPGGGPA